MTLARHVVPYSREVEAVATIQRQYRGHLDRRYHFGVLNWVLFNILDNDNENVRERPPLVLSVYDRTLRRRLVLYVSELSR